MINGPEIVYIFVTQKSFKLFSDDSFKNKILILPKSMAAVVSPLNNVTELGTSKLPNCQEGTDWHGKADDGS